MSRGGQPRGTGRGHAAARLVAIATPLGCAAYGIARPDDLLIGGAAWLVALLACLAGYGALVERVVRADADLGLRLAWGAAAYLVAAGWLLAVGVLTHGALGGLVGIGLAAYVWQQITGPSVVLAAWRGAASLRHRPGAAACYALVGLVALVNVASAIAEVQGNVYDDDVIYTPLVRRLLDTGDLIEPFSFRRMSAYGGQTVLQALGAVRGTLDNLFLIDGALFQIIALLQLIGLARRTDPGGSRAGDDAVLGLVLFVVVLMPDTSVNTGSYWTGLVLFLALYRTVALTALHPVALFATAGAIASGVCTLRQSYLPAAAVFLAAVLVFRVAAPGWRARLRSERAVILAAIAGALVALAPYAIATWRSNETFLYPIVLGTGNPDVPMQATVWSTWQELQFLFRVILEPDPFRITLMLLPVLFLAVDRRPGRPLTALTIAAMVSFPLLVHSFVLSNARNLWRYGFGYSAALVLILLLEGGRSRRQGDPPGVALPAIARVVVLASLVLQLATSGRGLARKYGDLADDLQLAASATALPTTAPLYRALQAAMPAGATVAMLLDEPYHLDHARNHLINLDTPGFASFRPGMPFFRGPEPIAAYLRQHGIRYLAFVRGDRSRYMYRRDFWFQRMLRDTELWRVQGAYAVDCLDSFAALAGLHRVLFEQDGVVLLDLAEPR